MSSRKRIGKDSKKEKSGVSVGASTEGKKVETAVDEKKKKKKGSWWTVLKTIGYFFFAILISTFLNYAVLNQESRMLLPEGMKNFI